MVLVIRAGMLFSKWNVLKGVLAGTPGYLAICVNHQHRVQHVSLRHGTGAAARAHWALSCASAA
eukprot:4683843-Pyramimonas_sp.AAC.1